MRLSIKLSLFLAKMKGGSLYVKHLTYCWKTTIERASWWSGWLKSQKYLFNQATGQRLWFFLSPEKTVKIR